MARLNCKLLRAETGAAVDYLDFVRLAAVVEGRAANGRESYGAAHATDSTVELMIRRGVGSEADGHEVFDLGDAVFVGEARDENVCRGPVKLLAADFVSDGYDMEPAAFGVVEKRTENAGGIEIGRAMPVDGAVYADEGDGAHVADDSVVFDGLVGHSNSLLQPYVLTF